MKEAAGEGEKRTTEEDVEEEEEDFRPKLMHTSKEINVMNQVRPAIPAAASAGSSPGTENVNNSVYELDSTELRTDPVPTLKSNTKRKVQGREAVLLNKVRFAEYVGSDEPQVVLDRFQLQVNAIGGQLYELWHTLLTLLTARSSAVTRHLRAGHQKKTKERFEASIYR